MTYANGTSRPSYPIERIDTPAVVCRQCDKAMVGGTLPARKSLCGGCSQNDVRPRVNRHQKRKAWRRKLDHFLDGWFPVALQVIGACIVATAIGYRLGKALGWL